MRRTGPSRTRYNTRMDNFYDTLCDNLKDEIGTLDAYKLVMSSDTFLRLLDDPKFKERCIEGGHQYPDMRYAWFDAPGGDSAVFPIDIDDSLPLGQIDAKKTDGTKPTINPFP